jgi:hypothetical protein
MGAGLGIALITAMSAVSYNYFIIGSLRTGRELGG